MKHDIKPGWLGGWRVYSIGRDGKRYKLAWFQHEWDAVHYVTTRQP